MPGVSRKTTDSAGGLITGGSTNVFVNGQGVARDGDSVASHGINEHASPVLIAECNQVFVNGILVVREGNAATCGHTATGSDNVSVGG